METAYDLALKLFAALAIGLLIGIERGWNEREEDEGREQPESAAHILDHRSDKDVGTTTAFAMMLSFDFGCNGAGYNSGHIFTLGNQDWIPFFLVFSA